MQASEVFRFAGLLFFSDLCMPFQQNNGFCD